MNRLKRTIDFHTKAERHMQSNTDESIDEGWSTSLPDGGGIWCEAHELPPPNNFTIDHLIINLHDSTGLVGSWNVGPYGYNGAQLLRDLRSARITAEKSAVLLEEEVETISRSDARVWSFIDFVYFSTVVQTTVGFGDIFPNSTVVRVIVICQLLVGYIILVVLINLSLSWHWTVAAG
jgi:hypothetical protein